MGKFPYLFLPEGDLCMRRQKTDRKATPGLRTARRRLLQSHSRCHFFAYGRTKLWDRYVFWKSFLYNLRVTFDDTDADVRSLAFLSRLTEALHASPFYSHLECGTVIGIGT
jgi:hypothetical protein